VTAALQARGVSRPVEPFGEAPRCRGSFHRARAAATWRPPCGSRRARPRPGARGAHRPAAPAPRVKGRGRARSSRPSV
jgi:hypothetical protein